jgi:hypothetical protein
VCRSLQSVFLPSIDFRADLHAETTTSLHLMQDDLLAGRVLFHNSLVVGICMLTCKHGCGVCVAGSAGNALMRPQFSSAMQWPGLVPFIKNLWALNIYGCILSTIKPRGLQSRGGRRLASLASFASFCFQLMPAITGAAPEFVQQLHVCFQLSSYSTVLLAVAKTWAPAPMRHRPEDKRP